MKSLIYPIMTVLTWGLWAFLPKIATRYISPPSAMIYEVIAGALVAVTVMKLLKPEITIRQKGSIYALINGVIAYVGVLLYLYAISKQDALVVAPLSATFPIVTLTLGFTILKERFAPMNYFGVFLALFSIFLILS